MPTIQHTNNDVPKLKRDVLRAMRNGIELLPAKCTMHFVEEDCEAVEHAVHLGSLTFEELMASRVPVLSLLPQDWPAPGFTYLLLDQDKTHFVWLQRQAEKVFMACFSKRLGRTVLLPPLTVAADGRVAPTITMIGLSPNVAQMAMNASHGALDGGIIMLARYATERARA